LFVAATKMGNANLAKVVLERVGAVAGAEKQVVVALFSLDVEIDTRGAAPPG